MKYQVAKDPKGRGWHYIREGAGFGAQVFKNGRRTWIQCGSRKDPASGKWRSYFFALGDLEAVKLADARSAGSRVKADAREGVDARKTRNEEQEKNVLASLPETTLDAALRYYIDNRNSAPSSKSTLDSILRAHLSDWLKKPLLSIDTDMLQVRYKEVIERVRRKGDALDKRYAKLSAKQRLLCAATGYHTGIKTGHDIVEGFGRVYRYWIKKHQVGLQRARVIVPVCPTDALVDDLLPQPQRVKSVPSGDLGRLLAGLPMYPGNRLHPLLIRFLLATGLRVGIAMSCRREYIKSDRIVIPAHTERSKVRWKKRHLEHMAYIVPLTPEIVSILKQLERVAPEYGDAATWLFPSHKAESGHMQEENSATLPLREHSGVRFTMHQLLHNFASAAEHLGYAKAEIAGLLGHAKASVTDRYIDERVERHRKMLIAIGAHLAKMTAPKSDSAGSSQVASPAPAKRRTRTRADGSTQRELWN